MTFYFKRIANASNLMKTTREKEIIKGENKEENTEFNSYSNTSSQIIYNIQRQLGRDFGHYLSIFLSFPFFEKNQNVCDYTKHKQTTLTLKILCQSNSMVLGPHRLERLK